MAELFLEGDRERADDGLLAGLAEVLNDRDQIGEALADAGAGLDGQVPPVGERPPDRAGHLDLLRAGLEARHRRRDGPVLDPRTPVRLPYVYPVSPETSNLVNTP